GTGVLRGAGDERGAAGVAELRVGCAVRAALGTARCQRPATATAEPSLRPVRFPTLVTVHGDTPSTPGRRRWFTFRVSDTTMRTPSRSLRTTGDGHAAVSSPRKKHSTDVNLRRGFVVTRRFRVVQSPVRPAPSRFSAAQAG